MGDNEELVIVLEILAQVEDAVEAADQSEEESEPESKPTEETEQASDHDDVKHESEKQQQDDEKDDEYVYSGAEDEEEEEAADVSSDSTRRRKRRRITQPGEVPTNTDGRAVCLECNLSFRENRNYFKHLALHDGCQRYACPLCERHFDLRRVHLNHVQQQHCLQEDGSYVCALCNKVTAPASGADTFKMHVRHHLSMRLPCDMCPRLFYKQSLLNDHMALEHDGPPYTCNRCEQQFETRNGYQWHTRSVHRPMMACKVCGELFSSRKQQNEHLLSHNAEDLAAAGIKSKVVAGVVKDILDQERQERRQKRQQHWKQQRQQRKQQRSLQQKSKMSANKTNNKNTEPTAAAADEEETASDCKGASRIRLKPHVCQYCNKTFTKLPVLQRHEARHTGEAVMFKCRFCDESFPVQRGVKDHELNVHCLTADGNYTCQWCSKTFTEPIKLRSHEWLHTKDPQYQCKYCERRCKSKSILERHENTHLGIKPHLCPLCGHSFSLKHGLKEHMMVHNGERPYSCNLCNKNFVSKAQLKNHVMRKHEGKVQAHLCMVCGKSFTTKASLQIHIRLHTGERPYSCRTCPKAFTNKMALRRHEVVMHSQGDGPHICPYCSKEFAYKYSMYYHKRLVHETQATLKCAYCPKLFRRRQEVQLHELVHTGVKDYKCTVCGKAFRTNSQLLEHNAIHQGTPRFSCPECDKAFVHRSSYKRHVMLHRGLLPYECPFCDKAFPDRSNMLSHVRHIHKEHDVRSVSTPRVRHPPALLPQQLRKYPKPRIMASDNSNMIISQQQQDEQQVAVQVVKSEDDMLQTLLEPASVKLEEVEEQMNLVEVETDEGERQIVCVPPGVQFLQVGDQVLHITTIASSGEDGDGFVAVEQMAEQQ